MDPITDQDEISACDLRREALAAKRRGEVVLYDRRTSVCGVVVETIVLESGRAGQALNADAVWGDWREDNETISLDGGYGSEGGVVGLDGGQRD